MLKITKVIEEIEVQENETFNEVYLRSGKEENKSRRKISVEELPFHDDLQEEWETIEEAVLENGCKHFALITYQLCEYSYHKELACELPDSLKTIGCQWEPLD